MLVSCRNNSPGPLWTRPASWEQNLSQGSLPHSEITKLTRIISRRMGFTFWGYKGKVGIPLHTPPLFSCPFPGTVETAVISLFRAELATIKGQFAIQCKDKSSNKNLRLNRLKKFLPPRVQVWITVITSQKNSSLLNQPTVGLN